VIQMLVSLASDIHHYSERVRPVSSEFAVLITSLVGDVVVDLNEPLVADDE
jgi:hypothetical protein